MQNYELAFAQRYRYSGMGLKPQDLSEASVADICGKNLYSAVEAMGLPESSAPNVMMWFATNDVTIFPYVLNNIAEYFENTNDLEHDLDKAFKNFKRTCFISFATTGIYAPDFPVFVKKGSEELIGNYPVNIVTYGSKLPTYKGGHLLRDTLKKPLSKITDDMRNVILEGNRLGIVPDDNLVVTADVPMFWGEVSTMSLADEKLPPYFIIDAVANMPPAIVTEHGSPYIALQKAYPWRDDKRVQEYLSGMDIPKLKSVVMKNSMPFSQRSEEDRKTDATSTMLKLGYDLESAEAILNKECKVYTSDTEMLATITKDIDPECTIAQTIKWLDDPDSELPKPVNLHDQIGSLIEELSPDTTLQEVYEGKTHNEVYSTLDYIDNDVAVDPGVKEYLRELWCDDANAVWYDNKTPKPYGNTVSPIETAKQFLQDAKLPVELSDAISKSFETGIPAVLPQKEPVAKYELDDSLYKAAQILLFKTRQSICNNPVYENQQELTPVLYTFLRLLMAAPDEKDRVIEFLHGKIDDPTTSKQAANIISDSLKMLED